MNRREAIEYLCRCFMTRENENVEFLRRDYDHLVRPVISKLDLVGMANFEEAVVNVGAEIFETRPAKMAYVCAFMEFICEIAKNNENISNKGVVSSESSFWSPLKLRQHQISRSNSNIY